MGESLRPRDALADAGPREFADVVSSQLPFLAAVATREVGAAEAEDVVQEALIRAWRRRTTFDAHRGSARSWLVAIVLDQARRHRSRRRPPVTLDHAPVSQPAEARLDLQRAIDALPRRQRQVVTLYYLADLDVREVADVLDIREGTVKSTLSDARRALHAALEQWQ